MYVEESSIFPQISSRMSYYANLKNSISNDKYYTLSVVIPSWKEQIMSHWFKRFPWNSMLVHSQIIHIVVNGTNFQENKPAVLYLSRHAAFSVHQIQQDLFLSSHMWGYTSAYQINHNSCNIFATLFFVLKLVIPSSIAIVE